MPRLVLLGLRARGGSEVSLRTEEAADEGGCGALPFRVKEERIVSQLVELRRAKEKTMMKLGRKEGRVKIK